MRGTLWGSRDVPGALLLAALAGCSAGDATAPGPGQAERLVLPPVNAYNFSAVISPGCQDTGYGINDSGAVVGYSACLGMGAFVKQGGSVTPLPRPTSLGVNGSIFPLGINLAGRIAGYSTPGDGTSHFRALLWTRGASGYTVQDLGTLAGGAAAQARALNAAGDVVGWSEIAMAGGVIRKHGFLRRLSGVRVDLVPANGYLNAEANDVNASGVVVGVSYTPIQSGGISRVATIWRPATQGSNTLLPLLLPGGFLSAATAVNDAGAIVGTIQIPGSPSLTHLARWQVLSSTVEDLSPSDSYIQPYDVGPTGLIVGERRVSGSLSAFAFGTTFATLPVPATGRSFAWSVNACEAIVGEGHQLQGGTQPVQVAALWTRPLNCTIAP